MKDRFKFRTYIPDLKFFKYWGWIEDNHYVGLCACGDYQMPELLEKYTNQSTGLKDKNGTLIYEGDIVKINQNYCDYSAIEDFYKNQNFVVEYFQPRAVYLLKPFEYESNDGNGIYDLSPDFYEFLKWKPCGKLEEYTLQGVEVISNIYENLELLEEYNG